MAGRRVPTTGSQRKGEIFQPLFLFSDQQGPTVFPRGSLLYKEINCNIELQEMKVIALTFQFAHEDTVQMLQSFLHSSGKSQQPKNKFLHVCCNEHPNNPGAERRQQVELLQNNGNERSRGEMVQISPSLLWGFQALLQLIERHRARSEVSLRARTEKLVTTSSIREHQLRTIFPALHNPEQYWPFRTECSEV